jgi:hypothetical protein
MFLVTCEVTLAGAIMIVEARNHEEALSKAHRGQYEDIDWSRADLVKCCVTGKAEEKGE